MRLIISVLSVIAVIVLAAAANSGVVTAQSEPAAPAGLQVANGPNPGEASVTWNAVAGVSTYRVGWLAVEDFNTHSANEVWRSYFRYSDVTAYSAWTVDRLTPGLQYYFIVGRRYDNGAIGWSGWETFTLDAATAVCPTDGQPQTGTIGSAPVGGDYDADNDGLIEIRNLTQLDAIRHDLDGNGDVPLPEYGAAFPGATDGMGCPSDCSGYELAADLNFDTNGNGQTDAGDAYWNDGEGWIPIGRWDFPFTGTFDGNDLTISNLYIDRGDTGNIGLFGSVFTDGALLKNLALDDVDVTGSHNVGALVGSLRGSSIKNSSVPSGSVVGGGDRIGGLVGAQYLGGSINRSSAANDVIGNRGVGGLVGSSGYYYRDYGAGCCTRLAGGTISSSYATGNVTGDRYVGGLVGYLHQGAVTSSNATGDVTGNSYVGSLVGRERDGTIVNSQGTGSVN